MKKLLLAAVGLTGLLASCGGDVSVGNSGYYGTYNPNAAVKLTSLTNYTTSHQLSSDARDQSGKLIPKGTDVICSNWSTDVGFNINWTGYLDTVGFQFKGYNTGNFVNTDVYDVSNPTAGTASAEFTLESGIAPLNIKPQAITVTPVDVPRVDILGYTYVRAQGTDANGRYSNIVETDYSIPVVTCYSQ